LASVATPGIGSGISRSVPRPLRNNKFSMSDIESQFWSGQLGFSPSSSANLSTGSQMKL
jgi:hypothetical protein